MLTSRQRAFLRGLANKIEPIFQIGKNGISDEQIHQLSNALEARELIKVHILESAYLDVKQTCNDVAKRLGAEPVQAIGSKFVLYRESENNKKIELK